MRTHKKIAKISALVLLAAVLSLFVFAVDFSDKPVISYNRGLVALAAGNITNDKINSADDLYSVFEDLSDIYGFNDVHSELKLKRVFPSATGKSYRFSQYYKNYKVFGRELSASVDKEGKLLSISGNYLKNINIASSFIADIGYASELVSKEHNCKIYSYSIEIYSLGVQPAYCYHFITDGNERIFLNASTLETVAVIPLTSDETIPSEKVFIDQTDYYGNAVSLPVEKVIGEEKYILADALGNIYMFNAFNRWDYSGDFYENYSNGVFHDAQAVTTYANVLKAYDYYTDSANIGVEFFGADNSNDNIHDNFEENNELAVSVFMHYGESYNNAAYVSGLKETNPRNAVLIFGDGDGVKYDNFGLALDVVAHEYQHIVTEYTAGLIYLNASGALNEAISDIFGAIIEGKSMTDDGFWLCGEDISLTSSAFRNAKNPSEFGHPATLNQRSPFCYQDHDHYNSSCDNGGVHSNSTIISHLFYNMYAGAPEFFNEKTIGTLLFDTLLKMSPDSDFEDFRILILQSADELGFPRGAVDEIKTAFDYAEIKAESGLHTVTFPSTPDIPEISVSYGGYFTAPENLYVPEGQTMLYWRDGIYGKKYYPGQKYKMPAYDLRLYPSYTDSSWNNSALTKFNGKGTQFEPFLISNAADLASLAYYVNNQHEVKTDYYFYNAYYKMTNDIDLKNISWIPIGNGEMTAFSANFDGNGKVIKNLCFEKYYPYLGLFGVMTGEIKNLGIISGSSSSDLDFYQFGSLAGMLRGRIKECYNNADFIFPNGQNVGGIAGLVWSGEIVNCYNTGNITGKSAGGITGALISAGMNINDETPADGYVIGTCYNTGAICGQNAGGIAGDAPATYFVNCINVGRISAPYKNNYQDVYSIGGITGKLNYKAGGIYTLTFTEGENAGIMSCVNTGYIDYANADYYGSLAGVLIEEGGTTGQTIYEKNIYKPQDYVSEFGYPIITGSDFIGERAKQSCDDIFEGDFDFDNGDYFGDFSRWSLLKNCSIFDSVEWEFTNGKMPSLKLAELWLNSRASSFAGGDGTESNPYKIATAEQLALLAYYIPYSFWETNEYYTKDYASAYYILTADIDLKGKIWTGIGGYIYLLDKEGYTTAPGNVGFCGHFNGNGYTVYNMSSRIYDIKLNLPKKEKNNKEAYFMTYPALFGCVGSYARDGVIENINLTDVNNVGLYHSGGLAAVGFNITIINCNITSGAIGSFYNSAGGIIAKTENYFTVKNCYNAATVSARIAGGIIGSFESWNKDASYLIQMEYCMNAGTVNAFGDNYYYDDFDVSMGGGIIGNLEVINANLYDCVNIGEIRGFSRINTCGGIVGKLNGIYYWNEITKHTINVRGCKDAGEYTEIGKSNYGSVFGGLSGEFDLTLNMSKCVTPVRYTAVNMNGVTGVTTSFKNNISTTDALFETDFDFDNIEYYFLDKYWQNVNAEYANDLYERFGNAPELIKVTFLNYDGSFIEQREVRYGCDLITDTVPIKNGGETVVYVFSGWDKSLTSLKADITVSAVFTEKPRYNTVTFVDWDDTVLKTEVVEHGGGATPPNEPTRESTVPHDYTFEKWDKDYECITETLTIKAVYTSTARVYTVTFISQGKVISSSSIVYGEKITDFPTFQTQTIGRYEYTFIGWYSDESFKTYFNINSTTVQGDTYLYAKWDKTLLITVKDVIIAATTVGLITVAALIIASKIKKKRRKNRQSSILPRR